MKYGSGPAAHRAVAEERTRHGTPEALRLGAVWAESRPSCETDAPPTPDGAVARPARSSSLLVRRGEPRSRRTHRTPRGEIRTRLYPKVWVTILPTLAPAQTLQSRLLGSTVCARSAQRLQSGGVLPAPDPPGPARALLSQRKRANEWEAGAPQRGAAKTSREEQRPTAGLAPAPRRLLRSQCSRGADGVTVAN